MMFFGPDFRAGLVGWQYPKEPMQGVLRGLLLFALMIVAYLALSGVFTIIAYAAMYQPDGATLETLKSLSGGATSPEAQKELAHLGIAGLLATFPAGVVLAFLAVAASHLGLPKLQGRLPLHWPALGIGGWFAVIIGFIALNLIFAAIFSSLSGIDSSAYEVCKDGAINLDSKAGEVEKALAQMSQNPKIFALAALSAMVGAPLAEEVLFRGLLFAAIMRTPLGGTGAVVISAALWSLMHLVAAPWFFVQVIFIMGLLLGVLLLRFGSLSVTIACHMAWNALVAYQSFVVCAPQ